MKITLIHPYRHHSYNTVKALKNISNDVEAFYGYYNKKGYFYNKIMKHKNNKVISKFLGYNDVLIDDVVRTSNISNILFLLSKIDKNKTKLFLEKFESNTLNNVKDRDVYLFLQDYCNKIIDYAYENNKIIIYDHIMPAGIKQRELLLREAKRANFPISYVDKFLSEKKIYDNYKNIEKANIILNASNATYNITEEVLGKEKASKKSFIIPYGSNFDYMNQNEFNNYIENKYSNINSRKLKILYVGSISIAKGINYLIDIIEELNNEDIEFGVIGVPNKEEDEVLLEKLLSFEAVKYYGSVPHKQIINKYKEYDAFIFTSIIEGFGMVTLEAMSMGLPCIVNEYCSSVVKNRINGFVVNNINKESYINVIREIKNNNKLLREISFNAYNESKNYSWNTYIENLTKIFKDNTRI